jgi:hypothetical protein
MVGLAPAAKRWTITIFLEKTTPLQYHTNKQHTEHKPNNWSFLHHCKNMNIECWRLSYWVIKLMGY